MLRTLAVLLMMLISSVILHGQEITVSAANQPLNKTLTLIRDTYDVNISFNDRQLSAYSINTEETFENPELAIRSLLAGLPLAYEMQNGVFIIYPVKVKKKKKEYRFSGQVKDVDSRESLPYSHLKINGLTMATDLLGNFNFISNTDSVFDVTISHLGYYISDSSFTTTESVEILLTPSSIGLKEVVISNKHIEKSSIIGSRPGLMKLNHKIAHFLPGFGDNSVFNLLRLMPGILASGELTNDLVIWGSYAGQSQVLFDGFTIFGLKNFNDNISSFNPLMAKDIEVLKGGFDARYGERVGGIVNITAKNGNLERPSFSVTINNMTLNGMVEIPIAKKASITFAVRHTYYNLYNPSQINDKLKRNNDNDSTNNIYVVPDYVFRDMNLKYTHNFSKDDLFYISMYGGNDKFSYDFEEILNKNSGGNSREISVAKNTSETNSQLGTSIFYGKSWRNGNTSQFSVSYSSIVSKFTDDYKVTNTGNGNVSTNKNLDTRNLMDEFNAKVDNRFTLGSKHVLDLSGGLIVNHVELAEDTFNINRVELKDDASRLWSMVQDNIALGKNAVLKVGSRFTYAQNLKKIFAEPRISVSVNAGNNWKFNAAWGVYNQFITKSSTLDDYGNYRYFWTISDNETIPVLQATHFVLGTSFHKNGWLFSIEPYFKRVKGITRYFASEKLKWEGILSGNSKMYGIDFFLQKDFKRHTAWIAYSLGKVEEQWPDLPNSDFRRSPHDQTHELKLALLLNFDPFYLSSNYVYGSGFPKSPYNPDYDGEDIDYSRWDISFIYKFLDRKVVGEVGLSLMNVLNTENIKLANFERIPANQTNTINIYTEAIPFTPTLYLKISM